MATNNIDLTKIMANLKATANPQSRAILDAISSRQQNTQYGGINPSNAEYKNLQVDPVSFYSGTSSLNDLYGNIPQNAIDASQATVSASKMGEPLANTVTPDNLSKYQSEGYQIKQLPNDPNSGIWLTDPNNPTKVIKDPLEAIRQSGAPMTYDQKEEESILRGGLSANDVQIDHIMPLWLGGIDDVSNKRLYTIADHKQKSDVEAVVRTLYYNGKIDLNQAREMVIDHTGKDTSGIVVENGSGILQGTGAKVDKNGNLTTKDPNGGLAVAEQKLKDWRNPTPKLADYWNEFTSNILQKPVQSLEAGIGLPVTAATAAIMDPFLPPKAQVNPLKAGMDYAQNVLAGKEGMSNDALFGGFTKGVIKGETLGWWNTYLPEQTGINKPISEVTEGLGNVAGTISNFLMLKGAAGLALGVTPAAGWIEGLGASKNAVGLAGVLGGAETTQKVLSILADTGIFVAQGQLSPQQEGDANARIKRMGSDIANGLLMGTAGQTVRGYITLGTGTAAISYILNGNAKDAVVNGVTVMGLHSMGLPGKIGEMKGIMTPPAKESVFDFAITGVDDKGIFHQSNRVDLARNTLKDRVVTSNNAEALRQQFLQDANAATNPVIKAKNEAAANSMAAIKKDLPSNASVAMKSINLLSKKGDKMTNDAKVIQARTNIASDFRKQIIDTGKVDETSLGRGKETVKARTMTPREIADENTKIRGIIDKNIADGTYDQATGDSYYKRALVAGREIWKGTLPTNERIKQDIVDMQTMADTAKDPAKSNETGNFNDHNVTAPTAEYIAKQDARMDPNDPLRLDPVVGNALPSVPKGADLPVGRHMLTGNAINEEFGMNDPTAANNIRRKFQELSDQGMNQDGNPSNTQIILSYRPDKEAQMLSLNGQMKPKDIVDGIKKPYADPQHNIQAFVRFNDGTSGHVGWVTREWKIDGAKLSQNNRIRELNAANPDGYQMQLLDKGVNKTSMGKIMAANNIHTMEVPAEIIRDAAVDSGQPYVITNINEQSWKNAMARNADIPSVNQRQIANIAKTMKINNIPAASMIKNIKVDPGEGSLINRSTVDVMAKITNDAESSIKTGDKAAFKKSIESDIGHELTPKEVDSFFSKKDKTTRDLHNLIDDVINRNADNPSEEAKLIRSSSLVLREDLDFLQSSAAMNDLPLDDGNPFLKWDKQEAPQAPALTKAVQEAPQVVTENLAKKDNINPNWKPGSVEPGPLKYSKLTSAASESKSNIVPTARSVRTEIQNDIDTADEKIKNLSLSGHNSGRQMIRLINDYAGDFERDANYRYKIMKDAINKDKTVSPAQKVHSLQQLDAVYNVKNIAAAKEGIKSRGMSLVAQLDTEARTKVEPNDYVPEDSDPTKVMPDGSKWVTNQGKQDSFWGNRAKALSPTGHTVEHLITAEGGFPPKDVPSVRIDGKPYVFKDAVKAADDIIKQDEANAKKAPLLAKLLSGIKKPEAKAEAPKTPTDAITSTFWDRVRQKYPNLDKTLKDANYDTVFKEDRQPKEVMDWIASIRAKKYNELPTDAYDALKSKFGKQMQTQEYLPTYPGSPIFKDFLKLWEKNYDPTKGEGSYINTEGASSDIQEAVKQGTISPDEDKVMVSTLDFFTQALTKIKSIQSPKVKEKAVEDLSRDMAQYMKTIKVPTKAGEKPTPTFEVVK